MLTFVDLSVFCFGFNGEISGILELISIDMVIKKNQGRISRLINNEKYDLMLKYPRLKNDGRVITILRAGVPLQS